MAGNYRYRNVPVVLSFRTSLVFSMRISNSAHIALTTFKNSYGGDIYEIVIGGRGNKESAIR